MIIKQSKNSYKIEFESHDYKILKDYVETQLKSLSILANLFPLKPVTRKFQAEPNIIIRHEKQ